MGEAAGPGYEVQEYGSDLTDEQWALVAPLLPDTKTRGEPRRHHRRLAVEAILSVLENGVEWRNLLSLEGWGAVLIVGVPVLVAAIPLALPRGGRWLGTVMVTFLMSAGVVLGILTIGVFYLPSVVVFIIAAMRARPLERAEGSSGKR